MLFRSVTHSLTIATGKFSANFPLTLTGYNSKRTATAAVQTPLNVLIDTVSDESARRLSGTGDYPASGYGTAFDSTISLMAAYDNELQMMNGQYQRPYGNWTTLLGMAGPNYATDSQSGDRWVTQQFTVNSHSGFLLTMPNTAGAWSGSGGNITSGIKIFAKVEGSTNWIDCNSPYPGVGAPGSGPDGQAGMVADTSSTYTVKKVTFGPTPRTGTLTIRIGLPSGSDKKFGAITAVPY